MKVLLTGGSGFLGSYVAEQLAAEGHVVRALVRPRSDKGVLGRLPRIEYAPGAIENRESLVPAVDGVDAIVHVAGIVKARKPSDFFEVNTQGTRNLIDAALARGGLKRFVYVSSLAAVGPSADGTPVQENAEPRPVTQYGRSKLEAERVVLAAADRMPVTVIRPPMIYGPRDRETLAFFTSVKNRVLPMIGSGENTLSVVYAADCAGAIVRAVDSDGPSGRTYFVDDGAVYTQRALAEEVERALGRRAWIRFALPLPVVKVAAAATQAWAAVSGTAQMLTLDKANELAQRHWVCSGEGARRDLGWKPKVQWGQGVEEAVKWYRAQGWL
ncbi:MAG: NAD-dependent epimerase/dehydratase family protein [Myxococcales bacterium]|nr:NAD-dependent epimerase/dehydratase family protein [Myxococcales bacterium]